MRIQLSGVYTLDEFENAISRIMKNFSQNNIQSVRNVNMYLNPMVNGRFVHLYDDSGNEIEHMVLDLAKHKKFEPATDDLSVVQTNALKPNLTKDS